MGHLSASMAEPIAIVYAPAELPAQRTAAVAVEVARVGAAVLRLPRVDAITRAAVRDVTDLLVLDPDAGPVELLLGDDPLSELHRALNDLTGRALHDRAGADLVVGGRDVSALFAGLAAGTHLRAGSADTPGDGSTRHDVQLVARAAALTRLAGRVPMSVAEARARWG